MIALARTSWPWISIAARLLVGGVWIAAGALKFGDPAESVRAVRAYQMLPEAVVPTIGHGLPALEVLVGVLMIVGLGLRFVSGLSGLMQLAFIIGIASVWARGIEIECGCFGGGGANADATSQYPWDIARDVGLLVLSALLMIWPRSRLCLDRVLMPPLDDAEMRTDPHG
ncbi:MAG: MauE/DoxX family redox-associated membrane protein [Nocardioidaceae bacterium]